MPRKTSAIRPQYIRVQDERQDRANAQARARANHAARRARGERLPVKSS